MNLTLELVDVFGTAPFLGNALAVVQGGLELATEQMQQIARWLNLSETTFVGPPTVTGADYRVRIFTLDRELPFAGHPTLGSCHAWLGSGGRPRVEGQVVQQCGAGLVTLRNEGGQLAFEAPPLIRSGEVAEERLRGLADFLHISRQDIVDATWGDNGPGWILLQLPSAEFVRALRPQASSAQRIEVGVVGAAPPDAGFAWELRAFFSDHHGSVREDPVTGSLNAAVGQWLFRTGKAHGHYLAAQGSCVGRTGRIAVSQDADGRVWVGGSTVTISAPAALQGLAMPG